jgi:hypothetical protein
MRKILIFLSVLAAASSALADSSCNTSASGFFCSGNSKILFSCGCQRPGTDWNGVGNGCFHAAAGIFCGATQSCTDSGSGYFCTNNQKILWSCGCGQPGLGWNSVGSDCYHKATGLSCPPQITAIYDQPSVNANIDDMIFSAPVNLSADPRYKTKKTLVIHWNMGTDAASKKIPWNVSDYTGFAPSIPVENWQRGVNATLPGSLAVQIQGNTVGMLINPASASTATGTIYATVIHYDWPDTDNIRPWAGATSELWFSFEAQVPVGVPAMNGAVYAGPNLMIHDTISGKRFWYGPMMYDNRGLFSEQVFKDGCSTCTGLAIARTFYGSGTQYAHLGANSGVSTGATWRGFRYYEFRVSRSELLNIVNSVRSTFPQVYGTLSTDPANYKIVHFNINPEVADLNATRQGRIGMSVRNIFIGIAQ